MDWSLLHLERLRVHYWVDPVDEEKVDILELQPLETRLQRSCWVLLVRMPQLRRDEQILALNSCLKALLQCSSDRVLVSIILRRIYVTVPVLENRALDLVNEFLLFLAQESSKANLRHFAASLKGHIGLVCTDCCCTFHIFCGRYF